MSQRLLSIIVAWISRLLAKDEHKRGLENNPEPFFDMYGGLNCLLRCNYDSKFLERTGMSQFYNSILQFLGKTWARLGLVQK